MAEWHVSQKLFDLVHQYASLPCSKPFVYHQTDRFCHLPVGKSEEQVLRLVIRSLRSPDRDRGKRASLDRIGPLLGVPAGQFPGRPSRSIPFSKLVRGNGGDDQPSEECAWHATNRLQQPSNKSRSLGLWKNVILHLAKNGQTLAELNSGVDPYQHRCAGCCPLTCEIDVAQIVTFSWYAGHSITSVMLIA